MVEAGRAGGELLVASAGGAGAAGAAEALDCAVEAGGEGGLDEFVEEEKPLHHCTSPLVKGAEASGQDGIAQAAHLPLGGGGEGGWVERAEALYERAALGEGGGPVAAGEAASYGERTAPEGEDIGVEAKVPGEELGAVGGCHWAGPSGLTVRVISSQAARSSVTRSAT